MPLQAKSTTAPLVEKWSHRNHIWTVTYYKTPCLERDHLTYNQCEQEPDELIFYRDLCKGVRERVIMTLDKARIYRNPEQGDYDHWELEQQIDLEPCQ